MNACAECGTPHDPGALDCARCMTPTLRGRQWRALQAIRAYRDYAGSPDDREDDADDVIVEAMADLVADLMHLADTLAPQAGGVRAWSLVMARAHMNHEAEAVKA